MISYDYACYLPQPSNITLQRSNIKVTGKWTLGEPFEVVNYVTKYEKIVMQKKVVVIITKTVITQIQV